MRNPTPVLILLLLCASASVSVAQSFDFFYLVQQWPGSYCDTEDGCCYPSTGKPDAAFGIHGLWPNNNDGSYPSNCGSTDFDESKISDLVSTLQAEWPTLACPSGDGSSFWAHEWEKHGTCSGLDEHSYFQAALDLKKKKEAGLLQALKSAGIKPDGGSYSVESISNAIEGKTGFAPGIECNQDQSGDSQVYQIYQCVDSNAENFIECPVLPNSNKCSSEVAFPSF